LKSFITACQTEYLADYAATNQIPIHLQSCGNNQDFSFFAYDNHDDMKKQYEEGYSNCSNLQKQCLDRIEEAYRADVAVDPKKQLLMFISGAGGTGKSHIIKLSKLLGKIIIGKTRGLYGSSVALAPTGSAANQIEGFTMQSALNMGRTKNTKNISDKTATAVGSKFNGTRVIYLDEVSLLGQEKNYAMDVYLRAGRRMTPAFTSYENNRNLLLSKLPFGGFHIIYVGDFYQLPPVAATPLYLSPSDKQASIAGHALWQLMNYFVELQQNFRFDDADSSVLANFLIGKALNISL
jgi:hypothetical protein